MRMAAGMDEYLSKPSAREEIQRIIERAPFDQECKGGAKNA